MSDPAGKRGGHPAWALASVLFATALLATPLFVALSRSSYQWNWDGLWEYRQLLRDGYLWTLALSGVALLTSTLFGFLLALLRRAPFRLVRDLARVYVEVIRGTPLLVQILLAYYGIFHEIGLSNRFAASVLVLTAFEGAYISEIIRAGIENVGASQLESARAIGFTTVQTYRFVIIPQAIRQVLPPLTGQFASLIKDSSLLSIIGFTEFTYAAQQVSSFTYGTLESYIPLAVGYLALTLPISLTARALEKRHHFDT